jgi:hypothetical protein
LLHALGDRLLGGLDLSLDERVSWSQQLVIELILAGIETAAARRRDSAEGH